MRNRVAVNKKDIERYRQIIFKAKEACRHKFAQESFEKKVKIAFDLFKQSEYLKKFKINEMKTR